MSYIENINDLNASGLVGTEIMNYLNMAPLQLEDPIFFNKFKDVISHLSKLDSNERMRVIRNITKGELDKFDALWQYCELQSEIAKTENETAELEKTINSFLVKENMNTLNLFKDKKEKLAKLKEQENNLY